MLLEQRKSIPGGVDLSYSGKPTAEVHQCSFVVAVAFKCCQTVRDLPIVQLAYSPAANLCIYSALRNQKPQRRSFCLFFFFPLSNEASDATFDQLNANMSCHVVVTAQLARIEMLLRKLLRS